MLPRPIIYSALTQARHFSSGKKEQALAIIQNKHYLRSNLHQLGVYLPGKYVHDHFTHWLSSYAQQRPPSLDAYFDNKIDLNLLCKDFIQFCFKHKIVLDKEKTLKSFEQHDAISDKAVKQELYNFSPKKEVNILGFGLGSGDYEKNISEHLISKKMAEVVKVYGFDPYAENLNGVELLTENQLILNQVPNFDIITARWVLHHVNLKERWANFINCINHSNNGAMIFVVEHGFLIKTPLSFDRKLYWLLNATFDVVANIGIRPHWFTSTYSNVGSNFFIHYLGHKDFESIRKNIKVHSTQSMYDVGPAFPNQTICCIKIKP